MSLTSLQSLYEEQLKDLYSVEKQILEALPKMEQAASNAELKKAFKDHLAQSKTHLEEVHSILNSLEVNPGNYVCVAMQGLIEEGEEVIKTRGDADTKDAALIAAAQRVEHYEMAVYGTARTYARTLGYEDQADRLQTILDQEGAADKLLTDLATGSLFKDGINEAAMS